MDNQEKIKKLQQLIQLLEDKPKIRKLSLNEAKENLRKNDPQIELSNTLKAINHQARTNEILASLISDNIAKPLILRILSGIII